MTKRALHYYASGCWHGGLSCDRTYRSPGGDGVAKQNKADLLLVDIRMPEVDGFEVITSARRLQPDLAVLVMTGFGTVETAIHALRQGVDGLI